MTNQRKPINRAKIFSILVACLTHGALLPGLLPVSAATDAVAQKNRLADKPVESEVKTRSIGSLHMSEGKVVIRQNQILVLSDANDSIEEAELSGVILDLHSKTDPNGSTANGIAFFIKGFSLGALDDPKAKESVRGNDGVERVGRIEDVTAKMLRIRTAQGIQAIPTGYIVDVKSPRAFSFVMPEAIATATGSIVTPSQAPDSYMTPSPTRDAANLVSFNATYTPDPNRAAPPNQVLALNRQLIRKSNSNKLGKTAAMAAGVAACFAIPIGIGLTCPPQR